MNNINFLKPDKSNLNLFLILGLSLVFISIFDVFLSSFFKINATGFLPTSISFLLPLIIGFIGLHFIRIEYSGIRRLDEINKNFNSLLDAYQDRWFAKSIFDEQVANQGKTTEVTGTAARGAKGTDHRKKPNPIGSTTADKKVMQS